MCFYSCHGRSQQFFRNFISSVFNRVQLVHRGMPNFCATLKTKLGEGVFWGANFADFAKWKTSLAVTATARAIVKIWQEPRPVRSSRNLDFSLSDWTDQPSMTPFRRHLLPSPVMPLLEARHLTKTFSSGQTMFGTGTSGQVRAVNDVSLAIEAGETLGLVGESGSGKSTLGRMLLRLIEPDSGEVFFDGHDVLRAGGAQLRRLRRDMQIIFQDPFGSLDPRMTVEQIVCEPMAIHGTDGRADRRQRAAEAMRAVGMDASALAALPA